MGKSFNEDIKLAEKVYELKDLERRGWVLRGIDNPESVAAHSWGTSFLTVMFSNYKDSDDFDVEVALKIAIIHDIAEVEIGDIPRRVEEEKQEVSPTSKKIMEEEAIKKIFGDEYNNIVDIWKKYEKSNSHEAIFVRDMNMIDMCLQALKYERDKRYDENSKNEEFSKYEKLDEFFATTKSRLGTNIGVELYKMIRKKYNRIKG